MRHCGQCAQSAERDEHISYTAYAADHGGLVRIAFQLATQAHDPVVYCSIEDFGVAMRNGFQQPVTAQWPIGIFHEQAEQIELAGSQAGFCAVGKHKNMSPQVQYCRADPHFGQHLRRLHSDPSTTQQGLDSSHKFARLERFGDIVVSTGFQSDHAIDRIADNGEHDDFDPCGATT